MNLVLVLEALLQERSVRLASKRLGLSAPAASRALGRLRASLQDPLFTRTRKGMIPTPKALNVADDVRRAIECLERVFGGDARFDPHTARRVFRVAMTDLLQAILLPPLVHRIDRAAPHVHLIVEPRMDPDRIEALRDGRLDMVVALAGQHSTSTARETELFHDEFVCIVRRDAPFRRLSLSRYVRARHVVVAPHGLPGSLVDAALMQRGLQREVAFVVPHFSTVMPLVADSDLVATVPSTVARSYPTPRIRVVPCPVPIAALRFCIFSRDSDADEGVMWLMRMLKEVVTTLARGAKRRESLLRIAPSARV
jgi:DNA-binding transcriptional LysR family regulator